MNNDPALFSISSSLKSECRHQFIRFGYFKRLDGSRHQRFRCKLCGITTSSAASNPCYRQRRRDLNPLIFGHLVSAVSMRRSAILLRVNRKTIVRKMLVLGRYCERLIYEKNREFPPSRSVEFDDQETFEHSKLKPLSILMMVESGTRRILGWNVSVMPSKGRLAEKSRKKYGVRTDERKVNRNALFKILKPHIAVNAIIKSDKNPHYGSSVHQHFPDAEHVTYKGRRGCVVGQGELKSGGFDELFTLNHTFAMFRDNLKRLARKTWCTTKLKERLHFQLAMYVYYHNYKLIPQIQNANISWPGSGPFAQLVNN